MCRAAKILTPVRDGNMGLLGALCGAGDVGIFDTADFLQKSVPQTGIGVLYLIKSIELIKFNCSDFDRSKNGLRPSTRDAEYLGPGLDAKCGMISIAAGIPR
jgi:hypothetical protein